MPQDLIVSEQSFEGQRQSTIGGLIQSEISGLLVHTNTIEEYNALDLNVLIEQEWAKSCSKHSEGVVNPSELNRFILVVFGDLKNYKFATRTILLEQETGHIEQRKANRLTAFVTPEQK